jgi:CHRD domain
MARKRSTTAALAVVGALAVGLTGGAVAEGATTLHATLSGKKEVPKADGGSGSATITLKPGKGQVCFTIKVKKVGTMVMGHIHKGGKGVAGPIVVPLFTSPTKHPKGCASASKTMIRAIAKHPGRYYVNVHTQKFPAGAARGQLHH